MKNLGVKIKTIEQVAKGMLQPIRSLPLERSELALAGIIMKCAITYSGMNETSTLDATIETCVEFVLDHFKNLGLNEIEEAFKLASAGKTAANITAYYGRFTCGILGDVLTAYTEERKHIFAAIKDAEEEQAKKEQAEAKKILLNAKARAFALKEFQEKHWLVWQDVPVSYYDTLKEAGVLEYTEEEKLEIWEEAKQIGQSQISKGAYQEGNQILKKKCNEILKGIAKGGAPAIIAKEERRTWCVAIYTKLLIYKKTNDE